MLKRIGVRRGVTLIVIGAICALTFIAGCAPNGTGKADAETQPASTNAAKYAEALPAEWKEGQPVGAVSQWSRSKHAEEGVNCSDCHGDDPQNMKTPTVTTCTPCHANQAEEFAQSTHSTAIVHAMSKDSTTYMGVEVDYKWQAYPEGGPDKWGCANCHSVGTINEDESLGDCNTCHDGHEYSLVEARSPETCSGCHAGPGHPQYESYMDSRHGAMYQTMGDEWDLSGTTAEFWARQETDPIGAPTCASCHMSQGSHNTANGMAHDLTGPRNDDFEEQVTFMVDNSCTTCHTEEYSREWLGNADEMAIYTYDRMNEAKKMLQGLREDGLIRPTMEVTNAHPIAGQLSAVESLFFKVNMDTNRARKGAYHMSPQWAGRQGWTDQSFDLMEFRSEVERLRADAERDAQIAALQE